MCRITEKKYRRKYKDIWSNRRYSSILIGIYRKKDFWKLLRDKILSPGSILKEEAIFLLSQEFREPSIYFSILEAIALGKNTLGEIISFCGFKDKTSISPYINRLILLEIVKREKPILSKQKKKFVYKINDEYFNFYFRLHLILIFHR